VAGGRDGLLDIGGVGAAVPVRTPTPAQPLRGGSAFREYRSGKQEVRSYVIDARRESVMRPFILGPAVALLLALLLAACGEPTPTPFPTETAPPASATPAPTETPTPVPLETYENEEGGFRIELPADWRVERRGTTSLGIHYWVGPEPLGPGPASSAFFIGDAEEVTPLEAAEALHCGRGCAETIALEETALGGRAAQRATLTEEGLEWFFVENGGRLLMLTVHDPQTLATRDDLLQTLAFGEPVAAAGTPVPEATATATPTPTAEPTAAAADPLAVGEWLTVTVEAAGLSFEAPAAWEAVEETVWAPAEEGALRLGFAWQQTGPASEPANLLPEAAEMSAVQPLTPSWTLALTATTGISATVETAEGWQRHAVVQVGLRTYDFYAAGDSPAALADLQPAWAHMVDSVTVEDLFLYVGSPVNGSVTWFRALLQDPSGDAALPYMSSSLRERVPAGESPLALLEVDQAILNFNLQWASATDEAAVFETTITLADGTEVRRTVTMVNVGEAGWRVDEVVVPAEAEEAEATSTPEATPTPADP